MNVDLMSIYIATYLSVGTWHLHKEVNDEIKEEENCQPLCFMFADVEEKIYITRHLN